MIEVGMIVWANFHAETGLPYRAGIEAIKGDKARVRPLAGEEAATMGSARSGRSKGTPSVRARWVDIRGLVLVGEFEVPINAAQPNRRDCPDGHTPAPPDCLRIGEPGDRKLAFACETMRVGHPKGVVDMPDPSALEMGQHILGMAAANNVSYADFRDEVVRYQDSLDSHDPDDTAYWEIYEAARHPDVDDVGFVAEGISGILVAMEPPKRAF